MNQYTLYRYTNDRTMKLSMSNGIPKDKSSIYYNKVCTIKY